MSKVLFNSDRFKELEDYLDNYPGDEAFKDLDTKTQRVLLRQLEDAVDYYKASKSIDAGIYALEHLHDLMIAGTYYNRGASGSMDLNNLYYAQGFLKDYRHMVEELSIKWKEEE